MKQSSHQEIKLPSSADSTRKVSRFKQHAYSAFAVTLLTATVFSLLEISIVSMEVATGEKKVRRR